MALLERALLAFWWFLFVGGLAAAVIGVIQLDLARTALALVWSFIGATRIVRHRARPDRG